MYDIELFLNFFYNKQDTERLIRIISWIFKSQFFNSLFEWMKVYRLKIKQPEYAKICRRHPKKL